MSITVKNATDSAIRVQLFAGEVLSTEAMVRQSDKRALQCASETYRVVVKKEGSSQQLAQKEQVAGDTQLVLSCSEGNYILDQLN